MSADYNEEAYENALIELFQNMGWEHVYGPDVERDWHSPLYDSVLEDSIRRLNPKATPAAIDEALLKLRHFENAELKKKNALFMDYLQNGIEVSFSANGETKSDIIYIADFNNPSNNSFIVANQWTFIENSNKRPDILLFLNGLPVCLFELKSPSREQTVGLFAVPLSLHCLKATASPPLLSLTQKHYLFNFNSSFSNKLNTGSITSRIWNP